jgi:hypothetical protein
MRTVFFVAFEHRVFAEATWPTPVETKIICSIAEMECFLFIPHFVFAQRISFIGIRQTGS